MKKSKQDDDMPIGKLTRIDDLLPAPDTLVIKEDNQKVTITLSKESINFFKQHAKKNKAKYQTMIRRVLDMYVAQYK